MDQSERLVCPSHTKQYFGVLFIGIFLGFLLSFFIIGWQLVSNENAYESGLSVAKKRLEASDLGPMIAVPAEIKALDGVVEIISGNNITIKVKPVDVFADVTLETRIATVNKDTKFFVLTQKSQNQIEKEMADFMKKNEKNGAALAPEIFNKTPATIADVSVGVRVSVVAAENIKEEQSFSATEVQIHR